MIALFGSLTYAIIEAPKAGWLSAQSLALFAVALAALAGLLVYERRRREPLLELRFFRSVPFSSASVIAVCAFAALGGFLFLNTLYLQEVRGLSALAGGPVHAADRRDDADLRAALGPHRRPPRAAHRPARRRRRHRARRGAADRPRRAHVDPVAACPPT